MGGRDKNTRNLLWFFVIFGAMSGTFIGDFIGNNVPNLKLLKASYVLGMNAPFILNLKVMVITIGLNFNFNIMTIIGIILAIILYRKY